MTSPTDIAPENLMALVGHGIKLPALPAATSELLNLAHQPVERIDIHRLAALIEGDQFLTAAIIKLVNSPFYGRSRTISQVSRALSFIGLDEAILYLNYYMMKNLMPRFPAMPFLSQDSYFQHTWACATAARMLGRPQFLLQSLPGELYVAGLMHDIGKIMLATYAASAFGTALQRAHDEQQPLHVMEFESLKLDHGTLGAHLLDAWNLPPGILDAVAYHHHPELAPPEHQEMAGLIQFADMIANLSGIGCGGNPVKPDLTECWIHRHGSSRLSDADALHALAAEVLVDLRKQAEMMNYLEKEAAEAEAAMAAEPTVVRAPIPASAPTTAETSSDRAAQGVWNRFKGCLRSFMRN